MFNHRSLSKSTYLKPNKMSVLSLFWLMTIYLQLKAFSEEEVKHVNMFGENWFDKIKNVYFPR